LTSSHPEPRLTVVQRTESFSDLWSDLGGALGCTFDQVSSVAEVSPSDPAAARVVCVGGDEARAFDVLRELRLLDGKPLAVVGADTGHRLAVSLVRAGADDYFALPGDLGALHGWLEAAVDRARAADSARALATAERARHDFSRLIGESEGIRAALDRASKVIPRGSATVLITGETGTGKELLAQAIHYNGPRASEPFVEVNCTALPESLLEAELFGYERGAFTDAHTSKPGLFEAAHGGTLFLDEIGDLTLTVQAKLLKALEEKRVRRIGSLKAAEVDVRIIAATHVDLALAVRERRFREDLFYRLNVLPIHLPALRERGADVVRLAEHFLAEACDEYEVPRIQLDEPTRQAIARHAWPGNVRELRNAVHRAVLLGDGTLRPEELLLSRSGVQASGELPFPAPIREIEVAAARLAVDRTGGNKRAAAELLGISRTRLYRLLGRSQEEGDV
jgi:DNA-binding NtrC family response regulator